MTLPKFVSPQIRCNHKLYQRDINANVWWLSDGDNVFLTGLSNLMAHAHARAQAEHVIATTASGWWLQLCIWCLASIIEFDGISRAA